MENKDQDHKIFVKKMISKIVLTGIGIHFLYTTFGFIGFNEKIYKLATKK